MHTLHQQVILKNRLYLKRKFSLEVKSYAQVEIAKEDTTSGHIAYFISDNAHA